MFNVMLWTSQTGWRSTRYDNDGHMVVYPSREEAVVEAFTAWQSNRDSLWRIVKLYPNQPEVSIADAARMALGLQNLAWEVINIVWMDDDVKS